MSMATKCSVTDPETGGSVEVHAYKDGMIQLHAIKTTGDDGPFDGEWQIVDLTVGDARSIIWGLEQAIASVANAIDTAPDLCV